MTDYEISQNAHLKNIIEIGEKIGFSKEDLDLYGNYKAKILKTDKELQNKEGKLILVTSTSPTPYGEGKTTLSLGMNDSLNQIGVNSIAVLREPSLGPVFGTKGGATGGGMSQVCPMEDINLHFTGDIHALTSANNLLCAIIDNHIFQGNLLQLDPNRISFQRCLDVNDRALRSIHLNKIDREDSFNISTASEMMAILCLASDEEDLRKRLGDIFIGYTYDNKEIYARDLKVEGALLVLLKDAIHPNLVQSLENNPVIIHGGPFANIAHGCNSLLATKMGLKVSDYVVTEAGFGSDMGALKFLDIKCRIGHLNPDLIVINTTIRGLLYNGENSLEKGIQNLLYHIENMCYFKENILVVLNRFEKDTEEQISYIKTFCAENHTSFAVSECYKKGSAGGIDLAHTIVKLCQKEKKDLNLLYTLEDPISIKIDKVCKKAYHASSIIIEEKAKQKIEILEKNGHTNLPICIAKTPYSISDNPKLLGYPKDFTMTVTDIKLNHGAGFITVYMGNIMTMPGLSKTPNYLNMDFVDHKIKGIF